MDTMFGFYAVIVLVPIEPELQQLKKTHNYHVSVWFPHILDCFLSGSLYMVYV